MKRRYRVGLITLLIVAVVAALLWFGAPLLQHKGYVLIALKGFRYESSLWAFVGLILVLWLLVYLLRRGLRLLVVSGGMLNPWSRLHRLRRVRLAAKQGFLELAEGRWHSALRHLKRAAHHDDQPLPFFLGAAQAAHELQQYEESDALLEQALKQQPEAEVAIALQHAQLQSQRGQAAAAQETLQLMHARHPQQPLVMRQLQQLYWQNSDWSGLLGLLPQLRKANVLGSAQFNELQRQAWLGRLQEVSKATAGDNSASLSALQQVWQSLASAQRQEPALLAAYAEQLRLLGAEAEAEELLRQALKQNYDVALVRLYGLLHGRDSGKQLQSAEAWLKQHPEDPSLLLTLGRLCLHNQLWGKARDYLEASLAFDRHPETCAELAGLMVQQGDLNRSNSLYQEGLRLLDPRLSQPSVAVLT
ncbi:heme biosynthesis HemY N-terminal domain-containing protein [Pseudomonas sp. 5P_3.1_Bac2]|uniref:heme biosynthesis HemY N-terminal domain-containing protein n=1 Tax=Pseudomonas sp. 5P_3.1_Bac2 TaxID=2971617 RepID=UPI0021C6C857|nr:heme biosynthesis HemY N-terminal domain-containing protein [Pseudomonas sp. 5P_3.1_Bac2]MCU1718003.1 heme biosynthesis protein HemY [Pseudomonas sp. 5P_3.1_Bac2]